jgi:hypothetical protein
MIVVQNMYNIKLLLYRASTISNDYCTEHVQYQMIVVQNMYNIK